MSAAAEHVDLRRGRRAPSLSVLRPTVDRLPPHSLEAEQGVLGCILLSAPDCMAQCIEQFQDGPLTFYDLRHQTIYAMLVEMYSAKANIDIITVHQRLKDAQQLETIGGVAFLASLPDVIPSAANLPFYVAIVLEKYLLRRMISTCTDTIARVYEHEGDVDELIDTFESDALALRRVVNDGEQMEAKALVHESINDFEVLHARQGALAGLATGFPDLDKMTWGLQAPDMIVIAARPSIGKTSLAMNIADHVAVELRQPVGVFSLEMSKRALMNRMICSRARVNIRNLREGFFSERDFPKMTTAAGKLSQSPLVINDKSGMNILQLRAKARRMHQQYGIKLFIIDYLQLLHGYSKKAELNRAYEIAEVSNGVKEMAKDLDVPVIILAQLNRDLEKRKSSIPMISDLKESGAIEQDADLIGLLYKPKDNDDDTMSWEQEAVAVNMAIAKQRNGPTGLVNFSFLKSYTRFESAARISPDDIPN